MRTNRLAGGYAKNSWQASEILKCAASFSYFCETYVLIRTPASTEPVPFKLHAYQEICADAFIHQKFVISLKPRQMGLSTLLQAFILWEALFFGQREIVVVSIKHSVAKKFLWRIKEMYKELPDFLRRRITNGNSRDIGSATQIMFDNGSNITVMGSTQDAARSESLTRLIIDEAAFQRYAETMWGAASPALTIKGQAIIISTAYGFGNFFQKEWDKALRQQSSLYPIKLHYSMWPGRDAAWLREQISLMGAKRVEQEIECNFLKSGDSVFSLENIREIEERISEFPPKERRTLYGQDEAFLIYEHPIPGFTYYIGLDIATGRSNDFTAFSILRQNMDYLNMPEVRAIEVACGKVKCTVTEAADMIASIGYMYNAAIIAPERNGAGEGTVARLQDIGYPNIYHHEAVLFDEYKGERVKKSTPGFQTTMQIRKIIVAEMDANLSSGEILINNPFFVNQAYSFVYGSANLPQAINKNGRSTSGNMYDDEEADDRLDDSILAACIANYVMKRMSAGGVAMSPMVFSAR